MYSTVVRAIGIWGTLTVHLKSSCYWYLIATVLMQQFQRHRLSFLTGNRNPYVCRTPRFLLANEYQWVSPLKVKEVSAIDSLATTMSMPTLASPGSTYSPPYLCGLAPDWVWCDKFPTSGAYLPSGGSVLYERYRNGLTSLTWWRWRATRESQQSKSTRVESLPQGYP